MLRSIDFEGDTISINDTTTKDILARLQDIEARLPIEKPFNHNDVPLALLSSTATLTDVIKAVNELIKRSVTLREVK